MNVDSEAESAIVLDPGRRRLLGFRRTCRLPGRRAPRRGCDGQHHARSAGRARGPDAYPDLQGRREPRDGDRPGPGVEGRRQGRSTRRSSSRATWWRSTPPVLDRVRRRLKERLPGFDVRKLVLSATHTHTAPVTKDGEYEIPKDGVMQPAEYAEFLSARIAEAAAKAWESRKPARAGWGLGHAVVAQNRRAIYADGRAADVRRHGQAGLPRHRGAGGPGRRGPLLLGRAAAS